MAANRKITDLNPSLPLPEHRFLVATDLDNFQVSYEDIKLDVTGDFGDQFAVLSDDIESIQALSIETQNAVNYGFDSLLESHFYISDVHNASGPVRADYDSDLLKEGDAASVYHVNSSNNLRVFGRWDGPFSDYVGTGQIMNKIIAESDIVELSGSARRFEGNAYISYSMNGAFPRTGILSGQHFVDWYYPKSEDIISYRRLRSTGNVLLVEHGPGVDPYNIELDDFTNIEPVDGFEAGESELKEGDKINLFIDFDKDAFEDYFNLPSKIEILDDGLAVAEDPSDVFTSTILPNGDHRYIIPVFVSDKDGDFPVSLRIINVLGTTGSVLNSSRTYTLNQSYPSVNIVNPTDYNGRQDGLREGETVELANTVSNWSSSDGDTIAYSTVPTSHPGNPRISFANINTHEDPKTVFFDQGITSFQTNLEISLFKASNGLSSSSTGSVRIANSPTISPTIIFANGVSSTSPNIPGTNAIKGGDTINVVATIDTKGEPIDSIFISVLDAGISDGSQTDYTDSYVNVSSNVTDLSNDIYQVIIPVKVTNQSNRDGSQTVSLKARNSFAIYSDVSVSIDNASLGGVSSVLVDNSQPSLSVNSINYPSNQQAIKYGDSVTIDLSASNYDEISFESPNGELSIPNPSTFSSSKIVNFASGTYNVSNSNLKISVSKLTNGVKIVEELVVKIANSPATITVNNLPSSLRSSPAGNDYEFGLVSNQILLSAPNFNLSSSQTNGSVLSVIESGTGEDSNLYKITIKDSDTKGSFNFEISARNLANIETTSCTPSTYNLAGFLARVTEVGPNSLFGGLTAIGTSVTDPNNLVVQNLSEAGEGDLGGTDYSYFIHSDTFVKFSDDEDDSFVVVDTDGNIDNQGMYIFNMDALSRASNADVNHPAKFSIEEL